MVILILMTMIALDRSDRLARSESALKKNEKQLERSGGAQDELAKEARELRSQLLESSMVLEELQSRLRVTESDLEQAEGGESELEGTRTARLFFKELMDVMNRDNRDRFERLEVLEKRYDEYISKGGAKLPFIEGFVKSARKQAELSVVDADRVLEQFYPGENPGLDRR